MDNNEAIVDQIVRSLSFEVVAIPHHVMQVDSTSKSTPLNVKIRVRKKQGAELRHGVLSMPKVDTRSDNLKKVVPERVRLVSSDQTIMNFDVLMEADFDKNVHEQNLNVVLQGEINNEENSNTKDVINLHTEQILPKKNRDIFGKCKPGGCLDPPFGEDKYSYQPTQQNYPVPAKDEAEKLRSSSIFKNNIFRRKKKSFQYDDALTKPDTKNKNEVESKTNLNDNNSLDKCSPYSNAIITYPHPSDSSEFPKLEDKKVNREVEKSCRKRYSSGERSKTSSIENGSYFMIPKKTRNLSNQNDLNKMQNNYTKAGENDLNIIKLRDERNLETLNISCSSENFGNTDDDRADESKLAQARNFVPVPFIVPLNAMIDSKLMSNEVLENNSEDENSSKPLNITLKEIITYDKNSLIADQKNLLLQEEETLNYSGPDSEVKISTVEKINHIHLLKSTEPQDTSAKQDMIDKLTNNHESKHYDSDDELHDNEIIMKTTSKENFNKSDFKSDPLLAVGEKSLLDVTVNQTKTNSPQNQSENYQGSSQDLSHIWENETEALKSMADVISTKTMLSININYHEEEDYSKLEKSEKLVSDDYNYVEDDMKQKNQRFLYETSSETDLQASSAVTLSRTNSSKSNAEGVTEEMLFDKEQNVIGNNNDDKATTSKIFKDNKDVQNYGSETSISKNRNDSETKRKELLRNIEKLLIPKPDNENKKSAEILELELTADLSYKYDEPSIKNNNELSQKNIINKQNGNLKHIDDFHINKGEVIKVAFKETSYTSFSEDDDITIKGLFPYSKRNYSDQSIMGSESMTHIVSGIEDDKLLKINPKSDLKDEETVNEETINLQTRDDEILNDTTLKQTPYFSLESEKLELKTQFETINDTSKLNLELDQISMNNLPEVLYKASITSPTTTILRKDVVPWKIDIALQSYLDKNNEKIIKSFNSKDVPEKRLNDTFLLARCYFGDDLNEMKIPIDQDNNLTVKIENVRPQNRTPVEFNEHANSNDELFGKKKIKMNVPDKSQQKSQASIFGSSIVNEELHINKKIKITAPVSNSSIDEEYTDYEEINKAEPEKYNEAIMSGDIRNTLNAIYERELIPLQGIIKGLREEIDALAAYQMKLNVQNLTSKRSKPLKLVHSSKKCCGFRRL